MVEEKRRVNAAIDKSLYENVMNLGYTISEAITLGFEKLLETPRKNVEKQEDTNIQENSNPLNSELIKSLQNHIASLENQLKVKDTQIENRDAEIANLTETIQKQVVNIYNLSNQKAIEAPGEKKRWWVFWK
jgi:uncharacterized protein (DUF3084 family)